MTSKILVAVAAIFLFQLAGAAPSKTDPPKSWAEFWLSVNVSPPPPSNFLEGEYTGKILNLTGGKLTDATAKRWALADLRRGRGDEWAANQLRLDIANAGVFGPPGLNGTDEAIKEELEHGVVRRVDPGAIEVIAIAVVAVPQHLKEQAERAGITDYVIVIAGRSTGKQETRIFRDGHSEPASEPRPAGIVRWQLDAGEIRNHPPLGELWYQAQGWGCTPDNGTLTGEICAIAKRAL